MPLEPEVTAVVMGVDRFTMWINQADELAQTRLMSAHCAEVKTSCEQMLMNAAWKRRYDFFQPEPSLYPVLNAALGLHTLALVNYCEFSCDLITESAAAAHLLQRRITAAIHIPYLRQPVVPDSQTQTTMYFARRTRQNGRKRSVVPVIYSDKPSKLPSVHKGAPCVHLEFRLQGSAQLQKRGIASIPDLKLFQHASFWDVNVHMHEPIKLQKLGQLLRPPNAKTVGLEALRKQARIFKRKHLVSDTFVLQNALHAKPSLCRSIPRVSFIAWVSRHLQKGA